MATHLVLPCLVRGYVPFQWGLYGRQRTRGKNNEERRKCRGESTNKVNLSVCQKNSSAQVCGVRWVSNNIVRNKANDVITDACWRENCLNGLNPLSTDGFPMYHYTDWLWWFFKCSAQSPDGCRQCTFLQTKDVLKNFLYVATLYVFRFNFPIYVATMLCLRSA